MHLHQQSQSSNAPSTVQSSHATSSSVQTSHVPSPTLQSSQPVLVSSSSAYEFGSQPYLEQKMCHREASQQLSSIPQIDAKYGYDSQPTNYVMPGENLVSMPVHGHVTPQVSLGDMGYQVQDSEVSINENLVVPEVITEWRKNVEDDRFYTSSGPFTSSAGGFKADPNDFCCLEPSVIPERVFLSERIPGE
ncbi:hypothetical protein V6N12_065926 [Hibiscus sabdariffa]|uniref:Uncharacterized protein n=1 Tax=Hibiscus sabdariffa TaxID=183260 RepID=A0ABR2BEC6_9ROSI